MGGSDHCSLTFLEAVATVNVLTVSTNDVKMAKLELCIPSHDY